MSLRWRLALALALLAGLATITTASFAYVSTRDRLNAENDRFLAERSASYLQGPGGGPSPPPAGTALVSPEPHQTGPGDQAPPPGGFGPTAPGGTGTDLPASTGSGGTGTGGVAVTTMSEDPAGWPHRRRSRWRRPARPLRHGQPAAGPRRGRRSCVGTGRAAGRRW